MYTIESVRNFFTTHMHARRHHSSNTVACGNVAPGTDVAQQHSIVSMEFEEILLAAINKSILRYRIVQFVGTVRNIAQ